MQLFFKNDKNLMDRVGYFYQHHLKNNLLSTFKKTYIHILQRKYFLLYGRYANKKTTQTI